MIARESHLNKYFAPWLGAQVLAYHELPIYSWPKEQGHAKKIKTQNYENQIKKIIRECGYQQDTAEPKKRLGLRVVFLGRFRGDQTNCLKSIEDALENVSYGDDRVIDFHMIVRWTAPYERILVEILQDHEPWNLTESSPIRGKLSSEF